MPKDFRGEYANRLVELMASGYSFEASCAQMGLHPSTVRYWERAHPDFAEARELGHWRHLAYYEGLLISTAVGIVPEDLKKKGSKGLGTSSIMFALSRRHPELYSSEKVTTSPERADREAQTIERLEEELNADLERFRLINSESRATKTPSAKNSKAKRAKSKG